MSWLKQSPSSNSLHDSGSMSGSGGNKHSQPPVTRFLACGTVYLTHHLNVPPSLVDREHAANIDSQSQSTTTSVRAKQVTTERGGSAVNILSILAQFNATFSSRASPNPAVRKCAVECALVAPLGSDAAGRALMHELELEGIRTRFCKVHPAGVPAAFVLQSDESSCRTIINHNPLPELSHEDFIAILGPILVPEHYQGLLTHHWHPHPSLPQAPAVHAVYGPGPGLPPLTTSPLNNAFSPINPIPITSSSQPLHPSTPGLPSNAPFSIFHLTGRSEGADSITLMNLTGVDGLARDRSWRDKATFTLDCTAPVSGEEAKIARERLFPHVDAIFFSKAYALSINPSTPIDKLTPRAFLLSQVPHVASHALLLVHWDHDGGALLSVPTREYLQSSVWTDNEPTRPPMTANTTDSTLATKSSQGTKSTNGGQATRSTSTDIRPETQLSLGSADPRYDEFGTLKSNPHAENISKSVHRARAPSDGSTANTIISNSVHSEPLNDGQNNPGVSTVGPFDYGFAEAFANVTPNSSWDYRANRTAVIYDSGDNSSTDPADANAGVKKVKSGLGLQTDILRMAQGPSGVIISEGIALSPSDVDSDVDVNIASGASRFVMEERIRRVYGPIEGDEVASDMLDYSSLEGGAEQGGNDSDVTEGGRAKDSDVGGPTRIGRLKKERMRAREEEMADEVRRQIEEEERANRQEEEEEEHLEPEVDAASVRSEIPKPKPPLPLGVVEAWQAGLLFALTRHVLPGSPYCPAIASRVQKGKEGAKLKKMESVEASDWGWKWRLDECLRFAAEVAGRRGRKGTLEGLAREMEDNGWLQ